VALARRERGVRQGWSMKSGGEYPDTPPTPKHILTDG
jgi:hypothetical protein